MKLSYWPAPTLPWTDLVDVARAVESRGWHGLWYADHFMQNSDALDDPFSECWTTLAALAATVPRLRLGPLVSGNTYRHPAVLAKMAATIDHICGGRFVLGIGAGWQENEHVAYDIPFFDVKERLARLDEACNVITSLFREERASTHGERYSLRDAPLAPKAAGERIPLLVGGAGERVTMRIAARYADEWNAWATVEVMQHKIGVLEAHCEALDRDPAEIWRSTQALIFLTDDAEKAAQLRAAPIPLPKIVGGRDDVAAELDRYREIGVDEFIVPAFNLGGKQQQLETIEALTAIIS